MIFFDFTSRSLPSFVETKELRHDTSKPCTLTSTLVSRATLLSSTSAVICCHCCATEGKKSSNFLAFENEKIPLQWHWINSFSHSTSLDWIFAVSFLLLPIIDKWFTWPVFWIGKPFDGAAKLTWILLQFISEIYLTKWTFWLGIWRFCRRKREVLLHALLRNQSRR